MLSSTYRNLAGVFFAVAIVALAGAFFVIPTVPPAASTRAVTPAHRNAPAPKSVSQVNVEQIATGLEHPWGLQFLPDGRMLVTERPGRLRIVTRDGRLSSPIEGLPAIAANGQGGLLDVMLPRDFASSRRVYLAFAESRGGRNDGTSIASAMLTGAPGSERLTDVKIIFRQEPAHRGGLHYGARFVEAPDGRIFITLGERFQMRFAQELTHHWGKVVRIEPDGRVPADNPFLAVPRARPEIWSFGHRNPQAAAINPATGVLWVVEHGPRGGDEINIVERGGNFGWPVIGYGIDYSGRILHEATHRDGMLQPIYVWVPSIAPSGMAFYTGSLFPDWRGNLLVGALAGQALHRLVLDGDRVVSEEVLLKGTGDRIRDVRQGPDGAIWLLVDAGDGKLLRLSQRH